MLSDTDGREEIPDVSEELKTIEAVISGRVQNVGFRSCVRKSALNLSVCGEVQNLDDGCVLICATSEGIILEKFLSSLYECPRAYIHNIKTKEIESRHFDAFYIVRGMPPHD
ncbi:MAG: acylphosphatase [Euryarchaeota archaeon]|nr:acylphosphatase [Euryarchaeota archaeon]